MLPHGTVGKGVCWMPMTSFRSRVEALSTILGGHCSTVISPDQLYDKLMAWASGEPEMKGGRELCQRVSGHDGS